MTRLGDDLARHGGAAAADAAPSAAALRRGAFAVDASGQATYRIDIDVPPGIAGAQPSLALSYGHGQPNGVLGVGWGLAGQSAITRVKATYAVDGFNGSVAYDARDRFALDGQRLVNVEGAYGAPGSIYHTELETWSYVRAGAAVHDGFTVVTKTGEKREYGTTADSRILAGDAVRVWALSATTDLNGNRVEYAYTLDPGATGVGAGAYYLDHISYGGRAGVLAPNRFVRFAYERRPDPILDPVGGQRVEMLYRLTKIVVALDDAVVRTYAIRYGTSRATGVSRIEAVTESGGDEPSSLPATTFAWQDSETRGFEVGPPIALDQHLGSAPDVRAIDVTGSGRTDLVQLWTDASREMHATVYLATTDTDGRPSFKRRGTGPLGSFGDRCEILAADVDGDGRTELVAAYASRARDGTLELTLATFAFDGTRFAPGQVFATGDAWGKQPRFFAMDMSGDGRTDIVVASAGRSTELGDVLCLAPYLSRFGSGGTFAKGAVLKTSDPATPQSQLAFWPMDANGDGMMDLVRAWREHDGTLVVKSYIAVSNSPDDVAFARTVSSELGTIDVANQLALLPVDVNGDGTQDLLRIWRSRSGAHTTLHLTTFVSDGTGRFSIGPQTDLEDHALLPEGLFAIDLDGAGATAIVGRWTTSTEQMFTPYRASPSGRYEAMEPFAAGESGSAASGAAFLAGDVNGDGRADLVRIAVGREQSVVAVAYASKGPHLDVVTTVTDPLGGQVAISYAPLSDPAVYESGVAALTFPIVSAQRYPNTITPTAFPVQSVAGRALYVVSEYIERNDGTRNRFAYGVRRSLTYRGAAVDLAGRGWCGFRQVSLLDHSTGRRTTTTRGQAFPHTGQTERVDVEGTPVPGGDPRVPAGSPPLLLSSTTTDYEVRSPGTEPDATVQILPAARWVAHYDYGHEHHDFTLGQTFAYDEYGNVRVEANLGYVDRQSHAPLNPEEVVYRHRTYRNDLVQHGWALGHLVSEKVTRHEHSDGTTFADGDYHLTTRTLAEATYNVLTESHFDSVANAFLTDSYAYDSFGNRISETKPGDAVTRHEFDPGYHTFPMRTTLPANAGGESLVVSYGYDPRFGVETARVDANGHVWVTAHDAFGRPVERQAPRATESGATDPSAVPAFVTGTPELKHRFATAVVVTVERTSYLDDAAGGLFERKSALQAFPHDATRTWLVEESYVDGRGREREHTRESGIVSTPLVVERVDYDGDDRPIRRSLPFFAAGVVAGDGPHAVVTTYDVLGRQIAQRVPTGAAGTVDRLTTRAYAPGGVVLETAAANTAAAYVRRLVHHVYDGTEHVREVTVDPAGDAAVTTYRLDALGRPCGATDPKTIANAAGVTTTVTYDSLDRRLTYDNPDQNPAPKAGVVARRFAYDATTGHLREQVDAAGAKTTFTHDKLGRVLTQALPDGRAVERAYDDPAIANGRGRLCRVLVRAADGTVQSKLELAYDAWGNAATTVRSIEEHPPFTISATFDPQQRIVRRTLPDGSTLARTYAFGRLASQLLADASVEYPTDRRDPWGHAQTLCYGTSALQGDGMRSTYSYGPAGQLYREVMTAPAGVVVDESYSYDALGQIVGIDDASAPARSQQFAYCNRRLTLARLGSDPAKAFEYDASGNLLGKDDVTYAYRAHFAHSGSAAGGTVVFTATQDACGRTATRTSGGTQLRFAYDGVGALRQITASDETPVATMVSDHDGRVLSRRGSDGATTLYVDPAYEVTRAPDGTQTVRRYLLDERGAVAEIVGGAVVYLRRDHKGNGTHAVTAGGAVVAQLAYDPFGTWRLLAGEDEIRRKYESRPWYAEVGLYDFGARYYDPLRGRFLTPDTQLGAADPLRADVLNGFAFELNNPINLVDPDGHSTRDWVLGLVVGLGFVAVGGIVIVASGGLLAPGVLATATAVAGYALLGGGLSAASYSIGHRDASTERFWKGWGIQFGTGAVIGGVTGGLGAGLAYGLARMSGPIAELGLNLTAVRMSVNAAYGLGSGAIGGTLSQLSSNVTEREIYDRKIDLTRGLVESATAGGTIGFVAGGVAPWLTRGRPSSARLDMDDDAIVRFMFGDRTSEIAPLLRQNTPLARVWAALSAEITPWNRRQAFAAGVKVGGSVSRSTVNAVLQRWSPLIDEY